MKKILIAGIVVIFAVAAFVFLTLSNLGPLVKKAVNTIGPQITRTDVGVRDVSISIFSGEARIKEFFLGNPEGFKSDQAMKVGSVYVDIDENSITKNPIIIRKIEILAPEITYEKISGTDNFQAILKNVKESVKAEKKPKAKSTTGKDNQGKKIVIHDVILKDGKVKLSMALLGGKKITAPLPDIHLKDIGKQGQGATPAEAFEKIFSSLYSTISAESVTKILNDGLKQIGNLKDISTTDIKAGKDAAQKAVDTAVDSVKSATEGVQSAKKGIEGLFKKE